MALHFAACEHEKDLYVARDFMCAVWANAISASIINLNVGTDGITSQIALLADIMHKIGKITTYLLPWGRLKRTSLRHLRFSRHTLGRLSGRNIFGWHWRSLCKDITVSLYILDSNTNCKSSTSLFNEIRSHKTKMIGKHANQGDSQFRLQTGEGKHNIRSLARYTNFPICSCNSNRGGKPFSMAGFKALLSNDECLTVGFQDFGDVTLATMTKNIKNQMGERNMPCPDHMKWPRNSWKRGYQAAV